MIGGEGDGFETYMSHWPAMQSIPGDHGAASDKPRRCLKRTRPRLDSTRLNRMKSCAFVLKRAFESGRLSK